MSKGTLQPLEPDDLANPKVNVSCLDFLLIELVPLAQRITDQLHAREQALIEDFKKSKIFNNTNTNNNQEATTNKDNKANRESGAPTVTVTTEGGSSSDGGADRNSISNAGGPLSSISDASREALFWRLDGLGYRVGQGLVER